jgi:CheY-like chemotaxis protein
VTLNSTRELDGVGQALLWHHVKRTELLAHATILVVDDDEENRWFVSTILTGMGATIAEASSAAAAFAAVRQSPPDLVVSDIDMPTENGYALMRAIRSLSAAAGGLVPAIALTASARVDEVQLALLAGFSAHLAKPASARALIDLAVALTLPGKS